jgi:formate-dependent nitrite reductase membrane component NrfD
VKPKKTAAIGFIFITLMIDVTGLGLIIPVMPKLIQEPLAMRQGMVGSSLFVMPSCNFYLLRF